MPRLSAFFGIVIYMYYSDHPPPHFHVSYAGAWVSVTIATGEPLAGTLPPRARRLVVEWAQAHRGELEANWDRVRRDQPLHTIAPLS